MSQTDEYTANALASLELMDRVKSPNDKQRLLKLAEAWLDLADRTYLHFTSADLQGGASPLQAVSPPQAETRREQEGGTMQEHNVEVRIGHDDDGYWWTIVIVDGDEALRRGPFEDQAGAEQAAIELAGNIRNLDDEGMRLFIAEGGFPTRH